MYGLYGTRYRGETENLIDNSIRNNLKYSLHSEKTVIGEYSVLNIPPPSIAPVPPMPSRMEGTTFWFTGCLPHSFINKAFQEYSSDRLWDTRIIHKAVQRHGFLVLDEIPGTFACMYFDGRAIRAYCSENAEMFTYNTEISTYRLNTLLFPISKRTVYVLGEDGFRKENNGQRHNQKTASGYHN